MREIDLLKVASKRKKCSADTKDNICYNYLLMQVQDTYSNIKNIDTAIMREINNITGVIYSDMMLPVIKVDNGYAETSEFDEAAYNEFVLKNYNNIVHNSRQIDTFTIVNNCVRLLLSLYVYRAKDEDVDFEDVRIKTLKKVRIMLREIRVEQMQLVYVRKLYSSIIDLYNTFLSIRYTDYANYLYLTKGVELKSCNIKLALEELEENGNINTPVLDGR